MSRFTMKLPSNSSMNFNPSNMASQFSMKLTGVVRLEGNLEVVLLEIVSG